MRCAPMTAAQTWGLASYWWFEPGDPNYAHADGHAITFHPKYNGDSNRQVFIASDGGIHRSNDARAAVGKTVAAVCGDPVAESDRLDVAQQRLQVTQFYHGAVYPDGEPLLRRHAGQRHAARRRRRRPELG